LNENFLEKPGNGATVGQFHAIEVIFMANIIGTAIKRERKAQQLTQGELGELAGTGLNFVSQLERGKMTVRLDKAVAVLKVLGLELQVIHGKKGLSDSSGA